NFEHLVADGAPIVRALIERVPTLTCLIVSRQRLNLAGEREFVLGPLPTPTSGGLDPLRGRGGPLWGGRPPGVRHSGVQAPDPGHLPPPERLNAWTPERLMLFESVQLFVDRAQAVRADFQVTRGNA